MSHVPVLLEEAVAALDIDPAGWYVDATYGRGGHSGRILEQLGDAGRLMALDRDPDALADAEMRFADERRFAPRRADFRDLRQVLEEAGWWGRVSGLLFDLGVSSPQLDEAERGFGFSRDGVLDMRMDTDRGESAAEWLAGVREEDLITVLKVYGEERYARRIGKAIVEARTRAPITRTGQLAEIVKAAHPRWERHHHPATRTFQAIRISINDELGAIEDALEQAAGALQPGGRLAVISFHSLEDRLVKRALRRPPPNPDLPRHLPLPDTQVVHPWKPLGKAIRASAEELERNPRARSATLRVAERTAEGS
ncbi:MAG: 16S rRNA (cytosine(1402)-N(4))-methyltransferase [Gammaproteobacteria bacterium]|nr:MAG: 16S rRNA (cytosine(1402)-N(4))-methyltransferase [Gammaproteobacteria bacterium]PIE35489.1 MAG: 16S rRNA (cytosine(1402)-N(4))-methyltransferase [Gammaproteobacteria bacterium]